MSINNNNINKVNEGDLDKNIIETIKKNQYPLINEVNQNSKFNNFRSNSSSDKKRKINYKINDNENQEMKLSTSSSMMKSGMNVIEGSNPRSGSYEQNFREKEQNNLNNINYKNHNYFTINKYNKLFNGNDIFNMMNKENKETEAYLDQVIKKNDIFTQTLQKNQGNNFNKNSRNLFIKTDYDTPNKNNTQNNNNVDPSIQGINIGAINYRSKYENYDDDNKNLNNTGHKSYYNSSNKNKNKTELIGDEPMKGN
jgi:hypothetical protein